MPPILKLIVEQSTKPPGPVSTAIMRRRLEEQAKGQSKDS
jgi:hypothetical protein